MMRRRGLLFGSLQAFITSNPNPSLHGFVLVNRAPQISFVTTNKSTLASSIGGNNEPPEGEGPGDGNGSWDEFFRGEESENMMRAREYFNENALPINFEDDDHDETPDSVDAKSNNKDSSALIRRDSENQMFGSDNPTEDMLASNPYMAVVSKISPGDLISKFTSSAHPRVQNAVRSTILSLIGGLPKMAFDTTTITTGQRLASLMFQLQMTGYLFKNAEYRLSLQQSLGTSVSDITDGDHLVLEGGSDNASLESNKIPLDAKVKGKLRIRLGSDAASDTAEHDKKLADVEVEPEKDRESLEMEVDAAAYMSELRSEVQQLRDELMVTRKEKEEALRKDLLVYIRTLPEQELRGLTNTISQDVLVAMKGLVNAVMSGIGEGQIGPDTVTEQSGEAMAQLCMWQLVVGYNLRTLEVREEMKKSLSEVSSASENAGDDASEDELRGAFE